MNKVGVVMSPSDSPAVQRVVKKMRDEWPKSGDPYWFLTSHLTPEVSVWMGTRGDQAKELVGNVFKTKEQAEEAGEKLAKVLLENNHREES